jgi:transcriptional regulator with XRE-family HTH domain
MRAPSPGPLLRSLRTARRLSQEELAERAEISTRHLSCVETGRALASREMLLILGSALDLPLRDRNALLAAGGFAPVYREAPLEDEAMAHVRLAIDHMLAHQEPHPAMLMDRAWNVLRINDGAARLFSWLGVSLPKDQKPNALRLIFDPAAGLRRHLVGFEPLAAALIARVRREADVDQDPILRALRDELVQLAGPLSPRVFDGPLPVALPVHMRHAGVDLRYFTTLTTLGTPHDITAQELRIEALFPMDDATRAFAAASRAPTHVPPSPASGERGPGG